MLGRMPAHLLPMLTAPVYHPFVHGYYLALSWGDVPTWLAAIGTVGALITAFIGGSLTCASCPEMCWCARGVCLCPPGALSRVPAK